MYKSVQKCKKTYENVKMYKNVQIFTKTYQITKEINGLLFSTEKFHGTKFILEIGHTLIVFWKVEADQRSLPLWYVEKISPIGKNIIKN